LTESLSIESFKKEKSFNAKGAKHAKKRKRVGKCVSAWVR